MLVDEKVEMLMVIIEIIILVVIMVDEVEVRVDFIEIVEQIL